MSLLLIGLMAFLVICLIIYGYAAFRRNKLLTQLKEPITIALLGHRESGKTIYLSVMQHEFAFRDRDGFGVEARRSHDRNLLHSNYLDLLDPERGLPAATMFDPQNPTDYTFDVSVRINGEFERIGSFATGDYPGELNETLLDVNSASGGRAVRHEQQLHEADAVFCLLDGAELDRLIMTKKSVDSREFVDFKKKLADVIRILSGNPYSVHFMITKWDILHHHNINLNQVVDFLTTQPGFQRFISSRPSLRVIPVSSVGVRFFDGTHPQKLPDATPDPINVRVPIALAFTDCIMRRLSSKELNKPDDPPAYLALQRILALLARSSIHSIQLNLGVIALQYSLTDDGRLSDLRRIGQESKRGIRAVDDAYIYMYEHFLDEVRRFDKDTSEAMVNRTRRQGKAAQTTSDQKQLTES